MGVQTYSAQQRRAVNLIWAAAGVYGFEPKFLAMKTDGTPDFYMNFVIGLVHKWFGEEMPRRLFDSWLGDVRQAVMDDLAWLALENAAYEKELPQRPALEELRQAHAREFFAMEYQTSRQEWMARNQLVYSMQAARWKSVLGKPTAGDALGQGTVPGAVLRGRQPGAAGAGHSVVLPEVSGL